MPTRGQRDAINARRRELRHLHAERRLQASEPHMDTDGLTIPSTDNLPPITYRRRGRPPTNRSIQDRRDATNARRRENRRIQRANNASSANTNEFSFQPQTQQPAQPDMISFSNHSTVQLPTVPPHVTNPIDYLPTTISPEVSHHDLQPAGNILPPLSNSNFGSEMTPLTSQTMQRHFEHGQTSISRDIPRSSMIPPGSLRSYVNRRRATHSHEGPQLLRRSARIQQQINEQTEDMNTDNDTYQRASHHRTARNCYPAINVPIVTLNSPSTCRHCRAILFHKENNTMCCKGGIINLPEIPAPLDLLELYTDHTTEARNFRQNIRAYNHIFSFTSMGVTFDETRPAFDQGIYVFRAHGSIYHKIGPLLPEHGIRPRFLQMFIYDTEHELENRLNESPGLHIPTIEKISNILDAVNPFVQTLRQLAKHPNLQQCKLLIKERPSSERQYSLPAASQVAAILVGAEDFMEANDRDIIVETTTGMLLPIKEYSGYYDPLQYPLLLPHGTYGWCGDELLDRADRISCCDYYSYMLQIRRSAPSIILYAGRLLQQYIVDMYIKVETQKLRWIRAHQNDIRAELYQGLQDCLQSGENDSDNVGRRTILPSSFVGSPRDMFQRYQDAMAVVRKFGRPDIFLTMTCNPSWPDITNELLPQQTAQDRPELTTRIFHARLECLKEDIFHKGVLGRVIAHVHVVEFQKRGLPHAHMLIIFNENDKLNSPDEYDCVVRAEIPIQSEEPDLYNAVLKHMIHGPCGHYKPNAQCMKNNSCSKKFPKLFNETTTQGLDSYPLYRRRDDNRAIPHGRNIDFFVDNRWVVPYNPWLLLKYDCHINVEICSSIKSIKYLYKYVYKGPDWVAFEVRPEPNYDEVRKYVDGRWICPPEASWKIFKFQMYQTFPSVVRLQIHLPNLHQVRFRTNQSISEVLQNDRNTRTMLTEFFKIYNNGLENNPYLYVAFATHYRWLTPQRKWTRRVRNRSVIGRMYAVSPTEGERFYLRILLNHVPAPTSFEYLYTVNGHRYATFKEAAEKQGLIEEDNSIRESLAEARHYRMPGALR